MQAQTFIFFGIHGSGKGTQVQLLIDYLKEKTNLDTAYGSTGVEFRKLVKDGNFTGSLIREAMDKGELLPDVLADTVFVNFLISELTDQKHLIADGYPRTVKQSQNFENLMELYQKNSVKIIFIQLSVEEGLRRNLLRGRPDDTEESIKKRLKEYEEKVVPAMEYFHGKDGYEFYEINGEQSVEDVHKEIIEKLGL